VGSYVCKKTLPSPPLALTVEVVFVQQDVTAAVLAGVDIATSHGSLQVKHLRPNKERKDKILS